MNNNTAKKSNAKNKQWLRNPDQRKTPKVFTAQFQQNKDGSFTMLGNHTKVKIPLNQHVYEWHHVDTRDLAREIRMNGILAR
jgi:hypothetical protein